MRARLQRLVFAAAALPFLPSLWAGFVDWDDPVFIVKNAALIRNDVGWMLTTTFGGHWHPLTWLSLALDRALWDGHPAGVHLTNLLLHAGSAVVLFKIARRLLGGDDRADWPAAFAALLFAVHPLRAESVAWAVERRDCLSGLLYLLTVLRWLEDKPGAALGWYAASLLSKGIGVTLPVTLALVDAAGRGRALDRSWLRRAAPFAGLALAFGAVGLWAARVNGALLPLSEFPLGSRLAIASYGLCFYALKTLLPWGLIPLYPLPKPLPTLADFPYGPCAALVAGAAAALWLRRREHPKLAACALHYAAALAPVLGAVRLGPQLVADRYSYLACLPLALLGGAALRRALEQPAWRARAPRAAGALLLLLGALGARQVSFWRNSLALWTRELAVRQDVPLAHHFLANEAMARRDLAEAERRDRAALAVDPGYAPARNGLGLILASQGRLDESVAELRQALALKPDYWEAANNLGLTLARAQRFREALEAFERALERHPESAGLRANYGLVLLTAGRQDEGKAALDAALALDPNQPRIQAIRHSLK
jgi:tetratricopeptide (TPR) repeat protein